MPRYWTTDLPVAALDDGIIDCGDYPDWPTACVEIKRRTYDRAILDELLESIPVEGLIEPLTLGVQGNDIWVSDGHHRAVALIELNIRRFRCRWLVYPATTRGRRFETRPLPSRILNRIMEARV